MLPAIRSEEYTYQIPEFSVERRDVESFMDELRSYHDHFHDCFQRSETRENVFRYMVGQLSEIERKSIEPIAFKVEEGSVRSMQRAISEAVWDEEKMIHKYRSLVGDDLGDPDGVLIFDESGFRKKGDESAGVARQYCGNLGKVENCQVGVFAAYASPHGYSLLDKRLFIPEAWFGEDFSGKRKRCGIPEGSSFKTKPRLAVEMLEEIGDEGLLPCKYVAADSLYGQSPDFIEAVEKRPGAVYFVSVKRDTLCWFKEPVARVRQYKYGGETRSKMVLEESARKPIRIEEFAEGLNDFFWYRRKVSEGTKGPIEYEFTKRHVTLAKDGLPWKHVWLIVKRSIGENPEYSCYISNAPVSTRLKTFVWLSGIRWAVEQCFEEVKRELGADQYEVRKYAGWNHHMLVAMMAHFFLWHLKIRLGKKSARYYAASD